MLTKTTPAASILLVSIMLFLETKVLHTDYANSHVLRSKVLLLPVRDASLHAPHESILHIASTAVK